MLSSLQFPANLVTFTEEMLNEKLLFLCSVFTLPLGLLESIAEAEIHEKVFDSATTTLMISNKEMEDILKIVKSFEDSGLFIRGATKAIENETKE